MKRESPRPGRVGVIAWFLAVLLLCVTCAKEAVPPTLRASHASLRGRDTARHELLPKLTPPTVAQPVSVDSAPTIRAPMDASVGDDGDASADDDAGDDAGEDDAGDAGPHRRGMRTLVSPRWRRFRFVRYHPPGMHFGGGGGGGAGGGTAITPRGPTTFSIRTIPVYIVHGAAAPEASPASGGGGPTTVGIGGAHAPGVPRVPRAPRPNRGRRMGAARRGRPLPSSLGGPRGHAPTAQDRAGPPNQNPAQQQTQNGHSNTASSSTDPASSQPSTTPAAHATNPSGTHATTTTTTTTTTRPLVRQPRATLRPALRNTTHISTHSP